MSAISISLECPDCKFEFSNCDAYRAHRCMPKHRVGERTLPFNARVGEITVKQGKGALSPEQLSARVILRELAKRVVTLCSTSMDVAELITNTYHIMTSLREVGHKLGWQQHDINHHPILVMLSGRIGALTKSDQMRTCVEADKEVHRLTTVL